jgi:uncharacterized protein (TIGR02678 family)
MTALHNQLAVAEQEDVARGIRLLLRRPLLTQAVDPDGFDLVRRRQQPLQAWFDYHCGWSLLVEPRLGYARLVKIGTVNDASRPARRRRTGRAPFDRRRYVLFCVVAAELLNTPVTTIGLLADRVTQACGVDEVLANFDSSHRLERMAFVDVLRLLEWLGAIEVLDGSSDSYVEADSAKVLYHVNTTLLIRLLAAPKGASAMAIDPTEVALRFDRLISALSEESRYGATESESFSTSDVRHNLWLRHSILRRLFDEPVVYRSDLTVAQREYLTSLTGRQIMRKAAIQAGFVLEEREEGYLLIDPEAIATDSTFPDGGSNAKIAALLLLDHLSEPPQLKTRTELLIVSQGILDRFPSWGKAYRTDDGPQRLTDEALDVLLNFRLIRRDGDLFRPLPAAARYCVEITDSTGFAEPDGNDHGAEAARPPAEVQR